MKKELKYNDFIIKKPIGGVHIKSRNFFSRVANIFGRNDSNKLKGSCSGVYLVNLFGDNTKTPFVMKIVLNIHHFKTTTIYQKLLNQEFPPIPEHQNIIQILHSFKDKLDPKPIGWNFDEENVSDNTAFFIMPFYPSSLDKLIEERMKKNKKRPIFKKKEFFKFIFDITSGILHLEKYKYVHRDVKEENIFISKDGDYLLGDLGCFFDSTDFPDFVVPFPFDGMNRGGSPYYMPNEIKLLKAGVNSYLKYGKYDIFSLGLVCYNLYSDKKPFGENKEIRIQNNYVKITKKQCKSKRIRDLIRRMMLIDFEKRLSTQEVFNISEKEMK